MCNYGETTTVRVKVAADLDRTETEQWRDKPIDACIAPLVAALQNGGIDMRGSCCGHGKGDGDIYLQDGRVLVVKSDGDRYQAERIV